jgi:hypothetical protein
MNSIGLVRVEGHLVAVAVLTRDNPSAEYGRTTVNRLSTLTGAALRRAD